MNEFVSSAFVTDQHNEKTSETQLILEEASGTTEDLDVDAISHLEVT